MQSIYGDAEKMPPTDSESALLWAASYTTFSNLAHAPKGTPSDASITTFKLNTETGEVCARPDTFGLCMKRIPSHYSRPLRVRARSQLTSCSSIKGVLNPAFLRHHSSKPIIYAATECIDDVGMVVGLRVDPASGALTPFCEESAHGASTCYLTMTHDERRLLFVNYWDSSLGVLSLSSDGRVEPVVALQPPLSPVRATGLADHLENRQSEPHAHAIVLQPDASSNRSLVFVPDLGLDTIRFYVYDRTTDALSPCGSAPCAPSEAGPHGPRYIEFSKSDDVAYVVNELSSTVSVFRYDPQAARAMADDPESRLGASPLQLVQLISTRVPSPPSTKNTCGRIAIHPSGSCVMVSNRGDDTIATFEIVRGAHGSTPTLAPPTIVGTHGSTPRHFQFAAGGRFVVAANQDTDTIASFRFDGAKEGLSYTGHSCACASPNFVCVQPLQLGEKKIPKSTSGEL